MNLLRSIRSALALASFGAAPLLSQAAPPTVHSNSSLTFRVTDSFTHIWSIRELSDGSVLLCAKDGENSIFLISSNGRAVRIIGRDGDGPNEYRFPRNLYAVGVDSTLITGRRGTPWLLLFRQNFVPVPRQWAEMSRIIPPDFAGLESSGGILSIHRYRKNKDGRLTDYPGVLADTVLGMLYHPNRTIDTVRSFRAKSLGMRNAELAMKGLSVTFNLANPFQSIDQAVIFGDGTIALAHHNPYSVEWRLPRSAKPPVVLQVPEAPRAVTATIRNAAARRAVRKDDGSGAFGPDLFPPWPATLPPFVDNAVFAGEDGRLYIQRSTGLDTDSTRVDAFARGGGLADIYLLPPRARLLGVTLRGFYLAVTNDDAEQFLVRYSFAK